MKKNIKQTYKLLQNFFPRISKKCESCNTCCKTYGWLLKNEAEEFIKKGYPVIKLNNALYCIDSFYKDKNGKRILNKIPLCRFYFSRRCAIQKDKPLDCRLYPIKIKFYKDTPIIGISLGCKYVHLMNKTQKNKLYQEINKKIKTLPKSVLKEYISLMKEVNNLSKPKRFWMKKLINISAEQDN